MEALCEWHCEAMDKWKEYTEREAGCSVTILLESGRYYVYKILCKFRLLVRHIVRCYLNVVEYGLSAKNQINGTLNN